MVALAYLRKSRVVSSARHVSWQVQERDIRALAERYGHADDLVVLSDWNRSGRGEKTAARAGYRQLLDTIAAGHVSAVYGYSLSRFARSLSEYARFAELCRDQHVPIRLAKEGEMDYASPSGRMIVDILARFGQFEAELAQERAHDLVAFRRARGDQLGPPRFAHPELVARAFEEAGSLLGAARLLTQRGVATRNGKSVWSPTAVRGILRHAGLLPPGMARGVRSVAPYAYSRLLRCQCGTLLTGRRDRNGVVGYYCYRARMLPGHGPQYVAERLVDEWARAEAALLDTGVVGATIGEDSPDSQRAAIVERQRLLNKALLHGMPEEEYDAEMATVERELHALDEASATTVSLDGVEWNAPADLVNRQLRALWRHVRMDAAQRPASAEWRLPRWRRAPPSPPG